jgi:hypothetical protein
MAQNRRKHANTLPLASLSKWLLVLFIFGVVGLSFVYLKNQLHATGDEIKRMEREAADLNTRNDILRGRIASLSSRSVLQRRLNEGFIRMIPVSDDRIVRVNGGPARLALDEIRAVSNEVLAK